MPVVSIGSYAAALNGRFDRLNGRFDRLNDRFDRYEWLTAK
jgi:hypothetical protein